MLTGLREGRFDAALLALPLEDKTGLEIFPLYQEPFVVALPASHPLTARDQLKLSDLNQQPMLLLEEGHCLRDQTMELCRNRSSKTEEVQATSLEMLRQMVGMNLGLTLLPQLAAENAPRGDKRLIALRHFVPPVPTRTIGLVWRSRSAHAQTLQRLAETLLNHLPAGVMPPKKPKARKKS